MLKSGWATLLSLSLGVSGTAAAQELSYTWTKGRAYTFDVTSRDTVSMKGMGLDAADEFMSSSVFSLRVERVQKNGTAEGTLFIDRFEVKAKDGRLLAGIGQLPASSLATKVEIDRKGRAVFREDIYLVVDEEGGNLLVSASADGTGSSASARAGGEEVTVWASFDPKTGKLSGGASVEQVAKKKKKKVKVKKESSKVDLVPRRFMELLRLPDGPVKAGAGRVAVDAAGSSTDLDCAAEVLKQDKNGTKLRMTMKSKTRAATAPPPEPEEEAEDEGGLAGLAGMPGVSGMGGLPGMGKQETSGTGASMDVDATAELDLNTKQGVIRSLKGTIKTKMGMAGMMSMETKSDVSLVLR